MSAMPPASSGSTADRSSAAPAGTLSAAAPGGAAIAVAGGMGGGGYASSPFCRPMQARGLHSGVLNDIRPASRFLGTTTKGMVWSRNDIRNFGNSVGTTLALSKERRYLAL